MQSKVPHVVLHGASLFMAVMEAALQHHAEIQVCRVVPDQPHAVERIIELQPTMVLIEDAVWTPLVAAKLAAISEQCCGFKVIVLALQAFVIEVEAAQLHPVQTVDDLVKLVSQVAHPSGADREPHNIN